MPKRALTAYSRRPRSSIVVGTLKSESVSRVSTVPDPRSLESETTATVFCWFWTTYSVLPASRIPSPFGTLSLPSEICFAAPVAGSILYSRPLTVWTATSVLPFAVASMPLRLNAFGT
jgi:hypothetical protein